MKRIRLTDREWFFDPNAKMGAGGFGEVFAGQDDKHGATAVKCIGPLAEHSGKREIELGRELVGRKFEHVLPVLDCGNDTDSGHYYVVMPRADHSLEDLLRSGKTWPDTEAARVIFELAKGLSEVPDLVHRDLKPSNILYHEGKWKLADFGIGRIADRATSSKTLKHLVYPAYAAPERWHAERATTATDIYSLGCVCHTLLTGSPPFNGPTHEDWRQQHLYEPPPTLEGVESRLNALLQIMLHKEPERRPTLVRVLAVLRFVVESASAEPGLHGALRKLAQVGATDAKRESAAAAESATETSMRKRRMRLAQLAHDELQQIAHSLTSEILKTAPTAKNFGKHPYDDYGLMKVGLAHATLEIRLSHRVIGPDSFSKSGWDVLTSGIIKVVQSTPPYTWSANLWFGELRREEGYRWWEASYGIDPALPRKRTGACEPFAIEDLVAADAASKRRITLSHVLTAAAALSPIGLAYPPKPIDAEDEEAFIARWIGVLALAAEGNLMVPSYPISDEFFQFQD